MRSPAKQEKMPYPLFLPNPSSERAAVRRIERHLSKKRKKPEETKKKTGYQSVAAGTICAPWSPGHCAA
jgi:hypothetical protein